MKNPNRVQASVIGVAAVIAAGDRGARAQQAGQGRGAAPGTTAGRPKRSSIGG